MSRAKQPSRFTKFLFTAFVATAFAVIQYAPLHKHVYDHEPAASGDIHVEQAHSVFHDHGNEKNHTDKAQEVSVFTVVATKAASPVLPAIVAFFSAAVLVLSVKSCRSKIYQINVSPPRQLFRSPSTLRAPPLLQF